MSEEVSESVYSMAINTVNTALMCHLGILMPPEEIRTALVTDKVSIRKVPSFQDVAMMVPDHDGKDETPPAIKDKFPHLHALVQKAWMQQRG